MASLADIRNPLPAPEERPDADVVIYDGHCRICVAQIHKLAWWDCQKHLAYLSLHDEYAGERYPDLSRDRLMEQMHVVDTTGHRYGGADAIKRLSVRLRRLWWLAPLMHFPGAMYLWRPLYRWIARNRYRFGGIDDCQDGTCTHRND